jgi:hypothetical protein
MSPSPFEFLFFGGVKMTTTTFGAVPVGEQFTYDEELYVKVARPEGVPINCVAVWRLGGLADLSDKTPVEYPVLDIES